MFDQALQANDPTAELQALLPTAGGPASVRVVAGLRVVALRHLPGGEAALAAALSAQGISTLPQPGVSQGANPWLVWTRPSEMLLITTNGAVADALLRALPPDAQRPAYALDQSAGHVAFELIELSGPALNVVLSRWLDASAIPQRPGQATRARFMDVAVVCLRTQADVAWLMFDASHGRYAAQWISHGLQTAGEADR